MLCASAKAEVEPMYARLYPSAEHALMPMLNRHSCLLKVSFVFVKREKKAAF